MCRCLAEEGLRNEAREESASIESAAQAIVVEAEELVKSAEARAEEQGRRFELAGSAAGAAVTAEAAAKQSGEELSREERFYAHVHA